MDADDHLVARSLHEPNAFEDLVGRHGTRLHDYLRRRAPNEADDLLCEVWLAAFAARGSYDPRRGEVVGWLFGITRNVLLGWFRAQRRASGHTPAGTEPVHDDWAAVDRRLDASGMRPALHAALGTLSPDDREVLLLVAWEQLTPTEVAGALGIPAGTARSRLHRARSRLATELATGSEHVDDTDTPDPATRTEALR